MPTHKDRPRSVAAAARPRPLVIWALALLSLLAGALPYLPGHAPAASAQAGLGTDGTSSACSDFRLQLLPFFEEVSVDIADEGWVRVDPQSPFQSVSGFVTNSSVAFNDTPANHDSHDHNTFVRVDPGYEHLISPANYKRDDPTDPRPNDTMEVEWETGGHRDSGTLYPHSTFPQWAWPSVGDRVWFEGHWILDCGHPETIDGADRYRSEIHPPRAVAAMRDQARALPGTGANVVPVTATDLYIHGNGGYITSILNCGMGLIVSDDPNSCPTKLNPIDVDFEFDISLPPRPFANAMLATFVEDGPENTVSVAPVLEPRPATQAFDGYDAETVLHVKVPLAGTGVAPSEVYARKIYAGWVYPSEGLRHMQLTLDRMDLHDDKDVDPGDCECTFFWMNVDRAAQNEWIRLAEFADGNMHDYDDDFGSGDGYMTFTGAVFDFYLRPGQSYSVRANGYDQDCLDWFFGEHSLSSLTYIFCYSGGGSVLEAGNNDPFAKIEATYGPDDYGLGANDVTASDEYELEFTVEEQPVPAPDADITVSQVCEPERPRSGEGFICTITVTNNGPGLPRDLALNIALTTGLPADAYTVSGPAFTYGYAPNAPIACASTASGYTCELVTLPVGGSASASFSVNVRRGGNFGVASGVVSATPDPDHSDNQAQDTVRVVQQVAIDIRPGGEPNAVNVNPRSNGDRVTAAILSTSEIDAPALINPDSLTFGRTGDEPSLLGSRVDDVNGDGLPDIVARFLNYPALFVCGDAEGVLRGEYFDGTLIEGRDSVFPVPCS